MKISYKPLWKTLIDKNALDVDNGAVMQDTIQDGGGNSDIGKDLIPLKPSDLSRYDEVLYD